MTKLAKRHAMAELLLMTFQRQRAPDDLRERILDLCSNGADLLEQNERYATASEIDVLRLTLAQIDVYERFFDAQVNLAKLRLSKSSMQELDHAVDRATRAILAWSEAM